MSSRPKGAPRLISAALASVALFAAADTAAAETRAFTFNAPASVLVLGPTADSAAGLAGPATALSGTVADGGAVSVPQTGLSLPAMTLMGITATLVPTDAGTGSFDDATGAFSLRMPVRLALTGKFNDAVIPDGCAVGTQADPLVLNLGTAGAVPATQMPTPAVNGKPFDRSSTAITLVDPAIALKPSTGCGDMATQVDNIVVGLSGGKAAIGLVGTMAIPRLPAPVTDQTPSVLPPLNFPKVSTAPVIAPSTGPSVAAPAALTFPAGAAKQKGLKKNGAVVGFSLDRAAAVSIVPTVGIPGAKKTTLKAVKKTLAAGKQSVTVAFPAALRKKVLKALKAGRKVTVTNVITATATGSSAPVKVTRKLTISR